MQINIIKNTNTIVEFEIIAEIVPCSRPKFSKFGIYYPKRYSQFKKLLENNINTSFNTQKQLFLNKPISLNIDIYKLIPKSYSKKKKELLRLQPVISRPDIDNYYKAILDSLSNVFYTDDSYITHLSGKKVYSDKDYEYAIISLRCI